MINIVRQVWHSLTCNLTTWMGLPASKFHHGVFSTMVTCWTKIPMEGRGVQVHSKELRSPVFLKDKYCMFLPLNFPTIFILDLHLFELFFVKR